MLIGKLSAAATVLLLSLAPSLACDDVAEEQAMAAAVAVAKAARLAAEPATTTGRDFSTHPPRAAVAALTAEPVVETAANPSARP